MNKLVLSGLSGSGLVAIQSPLLVARYNECLKAVGLVPTDLKMFEIDGKGWSPQIAAEMKNDFYLSHGNTLQYGIILTPEQKGKPVYHPFYSFERAVLDQVFETSAKAIADLTSRTGIWLEINPGITHFGTPEDLLLVESVEVSFGDTLGIMTAALEQRSLVERFRTEPQAWSDARLRQRIIDSAKAQGDLRFREVLIPLLKVDGLDCAYAEVFDGTFVLRNPRMQNSLLVVAPDVELPESCIKRAFRLSDPNLVKRLFDVGLVEVPVIWYRDNPEYLADLWETILADTLYLDKGRNGVELGKLSSTQKKGCAAELVETLPKEFFELEKFWKRLEAPGEPPTRLSLKLRLLLMRPHHNLTPASAKVVWNIISRLTTVSICDLYLYNKPNFFSRYALWPDSRKMWAAEYLERRWFNPQNKGEPS